MSQASNASAHHAVSASVFRPRFDIGVITMDCGREPDVERYDAAADAISWPLVDYSACEPTTDQVAINRWLGHAGLEGRSILHVGAGNSSVAQLAAERGARVVGVTVAVNELLHGERLGLPGYSVKLLNKHGEPFTATFRDTTFDIVVDNNLASFACCQRHFERYFEALAGLLADDGVLVTHWNGMQWVLDVGIDDVEPAWRLDAGKLETIASAFGLAVLREGDLFFLRRIR
ncbi:MAG: hypothetical protein GAK28_04219 [Luteibacter sp.]|nr:MAG: hypothetical protein GAK28_04219 [Luteibacter sp.]